MITRHTSNDPDRVRRHTHPDVLEEVENRIEQNIAYYSSQPPEVISRRIEELDREWDMERYLATNAATLALGGAFLGLTVSRKWFVLTCGVMGFLFQHAVVGWCPPVPAFRKLGVRTRSEIDREKYALKAIRGDFRNLGEARRPTEQAVSKGILDTVNR